jgi:ribonuclease HI
MIEIFTDGSSSGKKNCKLSVSPEGNRVWLGPGGYGWIICKDMRIVMSGHGGSKETTNNLMEMLAAIEGFKALKSSGIRAPGEPVTLVADSEYTLHIARGRYTPTKNLEIANELRKLYGEFNANWRWVRGHQYKRSVPFNEQPRDVLLNERCDQLAAFGKTKAGGCTVCGNMACYGYGC